MKSIKKLEHHELHLLVNTIDYPTWVWLEEDVLKLIDEMPYIDNDGNVLKFMEELKSKINGK